MAKINFRKLHRTIAPIVFLPLLISALTGTIFILGEMFFGESEKFEDTILGIHEGEFLGEPLVPVYVLLIGLGLVGIIVSGIVIFVQKRHHRGSNLITGDVNFRSIHSFLAPILFIPLLVSATTGMGYRIGRAWLDIPKEKISILMDIHQGSYFGPFLQVVYICLIGVGLISILITGLQMTGIFRKRLSKT
ncbi:PepSY domain-containing protein [Synechocystis salina LEGE 06155]|nr:PepSY domain-containing protein [Synechocystis salina LEGE 06155]